MSRTLCRTYRCLLVGVRGIDERVIKQNCMCIVVTNFSKFEDEPLAEFIYLVSTHSSGESYRK